MLFKVKNLQEIKKGKVSQAYRRWNSPRVNVGTVINTVVGQIEILFIERVVIDDISSEDAREAGFNEKEELLSLLNKRYEGAIFKIGLKFKGDDPRIILRNNTDISEEAYQNILTKLIAMDRRSRVGPWTNKVLNVINEYPRLRAVELADHLNCEKTWLKPNVRKLKNLGLTVSHEIGYSLSPLGNEVLKKLTTTE